MLRDALQVDRDRVGNSLLFNKGFIWPPCNMFFGAFWTISRVNLAHVEKILFTLCCMEDQSSMSPIKEKKHWTNFTNTDVLIL